MDIYGLVGKSLKHSYSGRYFQDKFSKEKIKADYRLFELKSVPDLKEFAKANPQLKGFNVTIPYKRILMQQMDEVSQFAQSAGSINLVNVIRKKGEIILKGFNTDIIGIEKSMKPLIRKRSYLRALILGTGGSAHAVAYVLRKWGIYYYYVSRSPRKLIELDYSWLNPKMIDDYKLIINTTPLGMYPDVETYPHIPYEGLSEENILLDLVYNPEETVFLKKGREKGAITKNGMEMLQIQAEESWKIWKKSRK